MNNQKQITKLWEERSQRYGREIEGVLPKSLPRSVNLYLDQWMFSQTKKALTAKKKIKVLDLGCGYGRVSKEILDEFPESETVGVDVAESYVNYYNQDLKPRGEAIVGDIQELKFPPHYFDTVVMITTFLYLNRKAQQEKCLKDIFRILKPGGKFVIIERNIIGNYLITLGGLLTKIRGQHNREIPAISFNHNYLFNLIKDSGGIIESAEGIPVWTVFLPISFILSRLNNNLANTLLKSICFMDKIMASFLTPSLYISYVGHVGHVGQSQS